MDRNRRLYGIQDVLEWLVFILLGGLLFWTLVWHLIEAP